MIFDVVYMLLSSISCATYNTVAAIWKVEEASINFMMTCFLFALRVVCHPLLIVPMLLGAFYTVRNFWQRRRKTVIGNHDVYAVTNQISPTPRTFGRSPRIRSYRSLGSNSSRSNDSRDGSDEDRPTLS